MDMILWDFVFKDLGLVVLMGLVAWLAPRVREGRLWPALGVAWQGPQRLRGQGRAADPTRQRRDRTPSPQATVALEAGGAGPYARGAGDHRAAAQERSRAAQPPPPRSSSSSRRGSSGCSRGSAGDAAGRSSWRRDGAGRARTRPD